MPQVQTWDRMCLVQETLDHIELLRNELYCPFCRLKNPFPPKTIVQPEPEETTSLKPQTEVVKLGQQAHQVIIIPDNDSDEGNEPTAAIKVTSRWADTQPKRTIANNERLIKAHQESQRNTFTKFHRDAGSAPVSSQDVSGVPQLLPGLKTFKVTVQPVIGRYSIEEDDPDHCKSWIWRKYDNATTVQTRDSRVTDQESFINTLASLVPLQDHIEHTENTSLYIAFSFNEKSGPVRIAEQEFHDAGFLRLLTEFGDCTKKSSSYLVYLIAERLQPPLYSQSQSLKPDETAKGAKNTKKYELGQRREKDVKVKSEPQDPITKKKAGIKTVDMTGRDVEKKSKVKKEPKESISSKPIKTDPRYIKEEEPTTPPLPTTPTFYKRRHSDVSAGSPASPLAIRRRQEGGDFVQPPAHSTRSKAAFFDDI